jgi:hypothetical protein
MSIERLDPLRDFAHPESCAPRVPRCNSRCAVSKSPRPDPVHSRGYTPDTEHNTVLIALSIVTSIATFLVVYSNWSF